MYVNSHDSNFIFINTTTTTKTFIMQIKVFLNLKVIKASLCCHLDCCTPNRKKFSCSFKAARSKGGKRKHEEHPELTQQQKTTTNCL